ILCHLRIMLFIFHSFPPSCFGQSRPYIHLTIVKLYCQALFSSFIKYFLLHLCNTRTSRKKCGTFHTHPPRTSRRLRPYADGQFVHTPFNLFPTHAASSFYQAFFYSKK